MKDMIMRIIPIETYQESVRSVFFDSDNQSKSNLWITYKVHYSLQYFPSLYNPLLQGFRKIKVNQQRTIGGIHYVCQYFRFSQIREQLLTHKAVINSESLISQPILRFILKEVREISTFRMKITVCIHKTDLVHQ